MKLYDLKNQLKELNEVAFVLPNGERLASHFHVTEVGMINKRFIDCGGTLRDEQVVNFQLWHDNDLDHRLSPQKLLSIIELSEEKLGIENFEIEVEYQGETIGKYGLDYEQNSLLLTNKFTDCLAKDKCGIPEEKPRVRISKDGLVGGTCTPGSGCC